MIKAVSNEMLLAHEFPYSYSCYVIYILTIPKFLYIRTFVHLVGCYHLFIFHIPAFLSCI